MSTLTPLSSSKVGDFVLFVVLWGVFVCVFGCVCAVA
jgi:hypothetical protein